jgi:hypothetical protein
MNNLNSVLIEGVVCGEPRIKHEKGSSAPGVFLLLNSRMRKAGKYLVRYNAHIRIVMEQECLIEAAEKFAHNGRGVRIVGCLAESAEYGGIYIEAEHIEYKPEVNKKGASDEGE